MRIDSCRTCGIELEVNQNCDVCGKAIEFYCHSCGKTTDKQIHMKCIVNSKLVIPKTK